MAAFNTPAAASFPALSMSSATMKASTTSVGRDRGIIRNIKGRASNSSTPCHVEGKANAAKAVVPMVNGTATSKSATVGIDFLAVPEAKLVEQPEVFGRVDLLGLGGIDMCIAGSVTRQRLSIRSYEIGADRAASIETIMNHLQDTGLNHMKAMGILGDGFATPEMCKRNSIWVITKHQVTVERYPSWPDVIEVVAWCSPSSNNMGLSVNWHIRDCLTGRTIARATNVMVMMSKSTRKLCKLPREVRAEIEPHFALQDLAVGIENGGRVPKVEVASADHVREGLTPRWGDLDVNQHVNNVKYVTWILESVPVPTLENYELASMTLEYRRECHRDDVIKSITSVSDHNTIRSAQPDVNYLHRLQLDDGAEILRGRTKWRRKQPQL